MKKSKDFFLKNLNTKLFIIISIYFTDVDFLSQQEK